MLCGYWDCSGPVGDQKTLEHRGWVPLGRPWWGPLTLARPCRAQRAPGPPRVCPSSLMPRPSQAKKRDPALKQYSAAPQTQDFETFMCAKYVPISSILEPTRATGWTCILSPRELRSKSAPLDLPDDVILNDIKPTVEGAASAPRGAFRTRLLAQQTE